MSRVYEALRQSEIRQRCVLDIVGPGHFSRGTGSAAPLKEQPASGMPWDEIKSLLRLSEKRAGS